MDRHKNDVIPIQQRSRPQERALAAPGDADHVRVLRDLAKAGVERHGDGSTTTFQLTDSAWAAIDLLLGQAAAENTTRSYAAARRLFMGWWLLTYARPFTLPVPPEAVAQFIADFTPIEGRSPSPDVVWVDQKLVGAGLKEKPGRIRYSTLKQRISAIAKWHTDAELPSPFSHPLVKNTLKAAKEAADREGDLEPRRRTGLQRDALKALLATMDAGNADDIRDRALVLFAWGTGGRRPSEVAGADIANLHTKDGGKSYEYVMRRSKTQRAGAKPRRLPLVGIVAEAMSAWLELRTRMDLTRIEQARQTAARAAILAGLSEPQALLQGQDAADRAGAEVSPAIFRSFRGPSAGGAMSAGAVGEVIKRRCAAADFQGNFGGHSLRRGWVTQGWNDKLNPADMMALSLHTSIVSLMVYNEAAKPEENPAATMLDRD